MNESFVTIAGPKPMTIWTPETRTHIAVSAPRVLGFLLENTVRDPETNQLVVQPVEVAEATTTLAHLKVIRELMAHPDAKFSPQDNFDVTADDLGRVTASLEAIVSPNNEG